MTRVTKDHNLGVLHPELVKEWHYAKNGDLTPYDVTPMSNQKVSWICPQQNHEYDALIFHRTEGHGCPKCRPRTSKIEIRLYCELKTIFNDVKWQEKIDGDECDVYLPRYKVAVELDGYYHHGKEERDRLKGNRLLEKGVEVFRVRHEKLGQVSPTDLFYRTSEKELLILKRLLKKLMEHVSFTNEDESKIEEYLESNQLRNNQEYRRLIAVLPGPLPEKSLAHLYPQLAKEWDYEKNGGLEPKLLTPGSNQKVSWICKRNHEWDARIFHRTRAIRPSGCPHCYRERLTRISKTVPSHQLSEY